MSKRLQAGLAFDLKLSSMLFQHFTFGQIFGIWRWTTLLLSWKRPGRPGTGDFKQVRAFTSCTCLISHLSYSQRRWSHTRHYIAHQLRVSITSIFHNSILTCTQVDIAQVHNHWWDRPTVHEFLWYLTEYTGVIVLHLLLVPGIAFIFGGARIIQQELHPHITQLNQSLLTVGYEFTFGLPAFLILRIEFWPFWRQQRSFRLLIPSFLQLDLTKWVLSRTGSEVRFWSLVGAWQSFCSFCKHSLLLLLRVRPDPFNKLCLLSNLLVQPARRRWSSWPGRSSECPWGSERRGRTSSHSRPWGQSIRLHRCAAYRSRPHCYNGWVASHKYESCTQSTALGRGVRAIHFLVLSIEPIFLDGLVSSWSPLSPMRRMAQSLLSTSSVICYAIT